MKLLDRNSFRPIPSKSEPVRVTLSQSEKSFQTRLIQMTRIGSDKDFGFARNEYDMVNSSEESNSDSDIEDDVDRPVGWMILYIKILRILLVIQF